MQFWCFENLSEVIILGILIMEIKRHFLVAINISNSTKFPFNFSITETTSQKTFYTLKTSILMIKRNLFHCRTLFKFKKLSLSDRLFLWRIFANEVAKAANFSWILKSINYTRLGSKNFPSQISALSESKPESRSPLYFWNFLRNHSCYETQHNPSIFIPEPNFPYNIACCDMPTIENDLIWDRIVFLSPFGIYAWFAIFIILVVLVNEWMNISDGQLQAGYQIEQY